MSIIRLVIPFLLLGASTAESDTVADPSLIARAAIDQTWGALTRAPQFTGSWSVVLEDGRRFSGDWAVADAAETTNRWTRRRWVHFVSSTTADYCAIGVGEDRLYCGNATKLELVDVYLNDGKQRDRMKLDAEVLHSACEVGSCFPVRVGMIRSALRPARATLGQTQMLFARIHRAGLAGWLTTQRHSSVTRATTPKLVLDVQYEVRGTDRNMKSFGSNAMGQRGGTEFDREVITYSAKVTIGPSPATVVIEPVEVGRFVEDCQISAIHGGCSGPQSNCTRRGR